MNQVPAVVGELVAKWRAMDKRMHSAPGWLSECADELESTLSALTAEAGKGELADLIAKLPSLKTLDAVDDDLRRGTRPCPLNNLTINDVKLIHRALSTATPAGEWVPIESAPMHGAFLVSVQGTVFAAYRAGSRIMCESFHAPFAGEVTHWRPLPSPPALQEPRKP